MMEGRRTWDRASGTPPPSSDEARDPSAPRPLQDAQYRYESLSRFTATVHDDQGRPVVFVMTRRGLDWKLSDIRLPLPDESPRSEERREGKEGVSTCGSRWSPYP